MRKSASLAIVTTMMLSCMSSAHAELMQLNARGTSFFSDFTVIFDDTGDGLLQHEEIVAFSGVSGTVDEGETELNYDGIAYVPEISGISTASGTINPDAPCESCWEFTPSNFEDVSDGWFATRWTYSVSSAPDMKIEFVGAIDHIQVFDGSGLSFPPSIWGLSVDDPVAGEMTYDSSAPPLGETETNAFYRPNASFQLESPAITIAGLGSDTSFLVSNDEFSGSVSALVDSLNFALNDVSYTGSIDVPPGFELEFGNIQLRTQDLTFLQDTSLPVVPAGEALTLIDPDIDDLFQVAYFARFDFRNAENEVVTIVATLSPVILSSNEESVTVPADTCTAEAGGCNPTGLHEFTLPDGFVPPPGATITQTVLPFLDSRTDPSGRCDGQTPQVLFDGDLIIPGYLCGSPEYRVIVTETNFDILEDTIFNTVFPDQFVSNPIDCNIPIVGDPQLQSAFVWQPGDPADVIEGTAIALTNDCGSSRGRVRGFSFIIVGLHIDFGLDFEADPGAVTQAFVDLTSTNLDSLVTAVSNAQAALSPSNYRILSVLVDIARQRHNQGSHQAANRIIQVFLMQTERIPFDTSLGFNHEGNLLSRADHIRFLLEEFIVPFAR